LHTLSRDHVIADELLFKEGDALVDDVLDETERNLRKTFLFTRVAISIDTVGYDSADVTVFTQDNWSLMGEILFGSGGGTTSYGAALREENLAGHGILLGGSALHRSENSIGWQGQGRLFYRRFLRSEWTLNAQVLSNRYRTAQSLSFEKPFITLRTPDLYAAAAVNSFGRDFSYRDSTVPQLLPFHLKRVTALYAHAAGDNDRYYVSVLASAEDVLRIDNQSKRQAYDNTARLLFSLGSLRQNFFTTRGIDSWDYKDVPIGAWGQAVVGYIIPVKNADRLFYVGARAEQSTMLNNDRAYLFGSVEAASAFTSGEARYTYLECNGIANYRVSNTLFAVARVKQQTAWNWNAFHQLVLDNDAGLRGYTANTLSGDNRFISNIELRFMPHIDLWIFRTSLVAFVDAGTVWNQSTNLSSARIYKSAGIGIRLFNLKLSGSASVFRLDVAYNFQERKFAQLIFSSDQLFSAFGTHQYRAPYLAGTAIDVE
jgi:outer membrane protein assembly factor BamA